MQTLEFNFVQFAHILRQLDIRVSSAEVIDAANALAEVDLLNKTEVKSALQATLIKNARDRLIFDKAFELFFVTPEEKQRRINQRVQQLLEKEAQMQAASEELVWSESQWQEETDSMEVQEVKIELTPEQLDTYTQLPEQAKEQIKKILEQASGNSINSPQELIQRTIQGALNYWKYHLLKQEEEKQPRLNHQTTGDHALDHIIEEVANSFQGYDEEIHFQDMKNISDKDLERAGRIIRQLARSLGTRISRRYRQSRKRRRVDIRRTIRKNIHYGGVMLDLKYITGRVQKPQLLLLCDVSESMARYGSFILQFIYGLSSAVDQIDSFIFSEGFQQVSLNFHDDNDFEQTMADFLNEASKLGRGTDLHQALYKLNSDYRRLLNSKTIVIIVSDTKTLAAEKALTQLAAMKKSVKDVIWLNTLPKSYWESTKTVWLFSKECRMFECYTLAHLEKIVRQKILG